ncbi:O-antigen ligase family protein [Patescibacteria group bacterium]|nr:O-antigen ligase family protein [Patescibacteria group bacterium]
MGKLLNWFKNRISLISSLVLLIAIPLYPKFPLKNVGGTWVSIRVDDLLIASVLFFWFLSQILKGFKAFKTKLFRVFFYFWLVGLISAFSAIFITGAVNPNLVFFHWLRRIEYMSLFFVSFDALSDKKEAKNFLWAILLALTGVFVYGIGQKYWNLPVISTMNQEFSKGLLLYLDQWTRISSTFAGHYDLAVWLVMVLSLLPAAILTFKKGWQKILAALFFAIAFYLLVLTASRVSFVAYLLGITTTLLLTKKYRWLPPILLISLFFGFQSKELNARLTASIKSVPVVGQLISEKKLWQNLISFRKKAEPTLAPAEISPTPVAEEKKEVLTETLPKPTRILREARTWPTPEEAELAAIRSSNIRFRVEWPRAVKAFIKNPLLGTGYSSLGLATDNDYLRMLGEIGLIGAFSFFLIIFIFFKDALVFIAGKKENWIVVSGLFGAMIGFLSNAVFIDVFEASKVAFYFWLLMGAMNGLITKANFEKKDEK